MRSHSKALFAVAALFALLVLAPLAQAAPKNIAQVIGHVGNDAGGFAFPAGVAINQTSGDVYVADTDSDGFGSGGQRISQFSANGDFIRSWGWGVATGAAQFEVCTTTCQRAVRGSGDGQFTLAFTRIIGGSNLIPPQVAVDQSDGSVYVADNLNNRVQKFSSSGSFVLKFGEEGSEDGKFLTPNGVAVDPVSGDVYVADSGNNRIQRFDSSGNFKSVVGSPGSGNGEFSNPFHIAVDSTGRLYVVDQDNNRIQRFTSAGGFDGIFAEGLIDSPIDIAVDPATDHVFISAQSADFSVKGIFEFDAAGAQVDVHAANSAVFSLPFPLGMAVRSSTGRIYASSLSNPSAVVVLDHVNAPSTTIDPVTSFGAHSATLTGEVNPNGIVAANWRFEVSSDGGATWKDVGVGGSVPEGSSAEGVSDEATGLEANTTYQVRLVGSKPFLAEKGIASTSFTTNTEGPIVQALDPGPVTLASAWLGAEVDPQNAITTYYVEYSTDPGFADSQSFPAAQDASAGSGGSPTLSTQLVKGLQPNTTYHYRVVATNVAGSTTGESRSFRTLSTAPANGLPDGRVWEKVSPVDKASADIIQGNGSSEYPQAQAAAQGGAVLFSSAGAFDSASGSISQLYLARRTGAGWSVEGINPPLESELEPQKGAANLYYWFSDDLSKAIVSTNARLDSSGPDNPFLFNLYMRDNVESTLRMISPSVAPDIGELGFALVGVSPDGSRAIFREFQNPGGGSLVERTPNGEAKDLSLLPDGTLVEARIGTSAPFSQAAGYNAISNDGSRVFFQLTQGSAEGMSDLYLRENDTTLLVSASERSGDAPTIPRRAAFLGASKDGSVAFFTSSERLTDDSQASDIAKDLYRWDRDAPVGERLTNLTASASGSVNVLERKADLGLADDGTSIYFAAKGDITGEGDVAGVNIYLWRENKGISLVARGVEDVNRERGNNLSTFYPDPGWGVARVTPDGRYLAFESAETLVAYDTNGKKSLYLYDSEADRLTCASCGTLWPKSKDDSWFLSCLDNDPKPKCASQQYLARNLTTDGNRLFFDSRDALVPQDTNGVTDTYQWSEGKLYLLSSGTSGSPSRLIDASADGGDIYFTTAQQLTASDKDDLVDLYDARVGGVPEPAITPPCVADECQGTPGPPPPFPTPSSSSFRGEGNVSASKPKPRCRKGKTLRKGRCTTRKAKRKQHKASRANSNRRAGR